MDDLEADLTASTDLASRIDLPSDRPSQNTPMKGFPRQAVEISKVLRHCLRQVKSPLLKKTLFQTFLWSVTWVSQLLDFWKHKTRSLRDNASSLEEKLTSDLKAFKEHLEEDSRYKIEGRDREILEWKGKFERLSAEKEALNDVLRHKLKELEIMNKAVEYDGKCCPTLTWCRVLLGD